VKYDCAPCSFLVCISINQIIVGSIELSWLVHRNAVVRLLLVTVPILFVLVRHGVSRHARYFSLMRLMIPDGKGLTQIVIDEGFLVFRRSTVRLVLIAMNDGCDRMLRGTGFVNEFPSRMPTFSEERIGMGGIESRFLFPFL